MSDKVRVVVHMTLSEREACLRAAEKERRTLSAWLRGRLFGLDSESAVLTEVSETVTVVSEPLTPSSEPVKPKPLLAKFQKLAGS